MWKSENLFKGRESAAETGDIIYMYKKLIGCAGEAIYKEIKVAAKNNNQGSRNQMVKGFCS